MDQLAIEAIDDLLKFVKLQHLTRRSARRYRFLGYLASERGTPSDEELQLPYWRTHSRWSSRLGHDASKAVSSPLYRWQRGHQAVVRPPMVARRNGVR